MSEGIRLKYNSDGTVEEVKKCQEDTVVECIGLPCELAVEFNDQVVCAAVQKNVWSVYRQDHACPRRKWYRDTKTGITTMKSWVSKCVGECSWPGGKATHGKDPMDGHGDYRTDRS